MHAVQINLFTANKYSQHLLKIGILLVHIAWQYNLTHNQNSYKCGEF